MTALANHRTELIMAVLKQTAKAHHLVVVVVALEVN